MTAIDQSGLRIAAEDFVSFPPHRDLPYSKRNWGGTLHSLCSYQGKLKPSIAHFLVSRFTRPGEIVLDPMSGVGTIPLEARLQGRIGLAGDLSPLAVAVSRAKLEPFEASEVDERMIRFRAALEMGVDRSAADFGLNGPISAYFHPETLREILAARHYFLLRRLSGEMDAVDAVMLSAMLHILHGNRPYALSRRSHPITPFAPTGEFEYRSVHERTSVRLSKTVPLLAELQNSTLPGRAFESDFRAASEIFPQVDAVITSPPFTSSFRFWSTNWMRLWFSGWEPEDFKVEPARYLESEQRSGFEPYAEFATAMADVLKPGGTMILHLGETARENMADSIAPYLEPKFRIHSVGRESMSGSESHGVDKGATVAHWYLFASRR